MTLKSLMALSMTGLLLLTAPATAQTLEDDIDQQLRAQGYEKVTISRTLLGRVFVVAEGGGKRREIVINPATGEVLRDQFREPPQYYARSPDRNDDAGAPVAATVELADRSVGDGLGVTVTKDLDE